MNDMFSPETMALLKASLANGQELNKATFNQPGSATTGLQLYDLEAPAKNLYPVLTPLRNMIPRVSARGGIQANWRAVTALGSFSGPQGVSEGRRAGLMSQTVAEYYAAYRGLGLEASVSFEADMSSEGFDDLKARAVMGKLQQLMIDEEHTTLGGNAGTALGTTPTPTLTTSTAGGALAATTAHGVICVALTYDGYRFNTTSLVQTYSRANMDGTTETTNGGTAIQSARAPVTTGAGSTNSITATATAVRGAVAYAWYLGTTAGTERFVAITTVNTYTFTAAVPGATQLASALAATDYSRNTLVYDGLLGLIANSAGNSYYRSLNGATLTGDGTSGITEWDVALKSFWDNYRLSPTAIWISSQEVAGIRKKVLGGGSAASTGRFTFLSQQGNLTGGGLVQGYLNPYSMGGGPSEIPIRMHPTMPPGTVLFLTDTLPYALNNVDNIMQMRLRREYNQIEWPLRTRSYEFGTYMDGVLQHYFPPSMGIITNIADG